MWLCPHIYVLIWFHLRMVLSTVSKGVQLPILQLSVGLDKYCGSVQARGAAAAPA